jgi:flagellar hook assembly protein FlgD
VYDSAGRLVRAREIAFRAPGSLSLFWDGRDDAGRRVPAGIYFARLALADQVFSKRLVALP